MKLNWNFLEGVGVQNKRPSMGGVSGLNVSGQLVAYATRFFILRLKNHM